MKPFDKVIGYQKVKDELNQILDMIQNPAIYEEMGANLPHGILFYGDPGMGKTLLATSFIEASGLPVYTVTKNKDEQGIMKDINAAFEEAVKNKQAIVFFDDIDKLCSEDRKDADAPCFVTIQSNMDACKDKGVLVVATANKIGKMPKSLLRSGRLDHQFPIEIPEKEDAAAIVEYYLRKRKVDPNANYEDITKMVSYSSCANLDKVINESAVIAARKRKKVVGTEDVVEAYLKDHYRDYGCTKRTPEKQRVASIHEAGHCAVAEVLRKGVVGLVSIHADEGFTQLDTAFIRRGQCVLLSLGGKVACELYESGRVASGCQSDLYKAFALLQKGVEDNAINGVGLLSPREKDETSESLKARVENVVASELERYLYLCRDILIKNRDFVLALADELYKKETLLYSDVQRIRASYSITPCLEYSEPEGATEIQGAEPDSEEDVGSLEG